MIERCLPLFRGADEDIIRVFYYDCEPYVGAQRRPISGIEQSFTKSADWLKDLAHRDLFAVRKGTIKWRGWKLRGIPNPPRALTDADFEPDMVQKGVDIKLALDIAGLAYDRIVERVILLTGDGDFIPALKLARISGLEVVVIHISGMKVERDLFAHADIVRRVQLADNPP